MTFDHVGMVVRDLAEGRQQFQALLGIQNWTEAFTDPVNGVYVQFGLDPSGICYELIAPLDETSPVTKALASGRNILNHIAYLVPDLAAAADILRVPGLYADRATTTRHCLWQPEDSIFSDADAFPDRIDRSAKASASIYAILGAR